MCERRDRAQNDVVLRNVGGGKEGSGSVYEYAVKQSYSIDYISSE